jgi:hypothetical protein
VLSKNQPHKIRFQIIKDTINFDFLHQHLFITCDKVGKVFSSKGVNRVDNVLVYDNDGLKGKKILYEMNEEKLTPPNLNRNKTFLINDKTLVIQTN